MSTRGIGRAVVALVLSSGWLMLAAGSSGAATVPGDQTTWTAPKGGETVATDSPHVEGRIDAMGCIHMVHLSLLSIADPANPVEVVKTDLNGAGSSTVKFSWTASMSPEARNGAYRFAAVADVARGLCDASTAANDTYESDPLDFKVAAPPAAPTGLTVKPAADRSVKLTWAANAEPDLTGYTVYRTSSNAAGCAAPGPGSEIGGASETNYTDHLGATDPGGPTCYFVTAARRGADETGEAVVSPFSKPAAATLPRPTASPTTASTGGAAAGTVGPGGVVPGSAVPGGGSKAPVRRPQVAEPPDPGFNPNLPFNNDQEDGAGDPAAVAAAPAPSAPSLPLREASSTDRVRTLGAFAGGLVAIVILGHLLLLRREVKRAAALEAVA